MLLINLLYIAIAAKIFLHCLALGRPLDWTCAAVLR